jgi:hypothetical protein
MSEPILAQPAHDPTDDRKARWEAIRQRTTRGLLLYNSGPAFAHLEGHLWAVRASEGGWWHVDLEEEACSCPDYEHRAGPLGICCKHVYAVAIAHASRRSGVRVRQISAAGDPIKAAGSRRLGELRDRYNHELLSDDERQELLDTIRRIRGSRA